MSEINQNSEVFIGGGPAREGHEQSFEQFQEEQRQTQQALAQLWKEEGKVKAQDDKLAQIIVQFLNDPANTHLFLLIARVVSQNVPSEFIIAIISLINAGAQQEIKAFLAAPGDEGRAARSRGSTDTVGAALTLRPKPFDAIPAAEKVMIDTWARELQSVAFKMPHRIIDSIAPKPRGALNRQLSPIVIQFAAVVLRDFLSKRSIQPEFSALHDFMQTVLVEIVKNTESFLGQQKVLKNPPK